MYDLQIEMMIYLACTFLFGLILGWLVWSFGGSHERKLLQADIDFWKAQLEQSRQKENVKNTRIDQLLQDQERLKKRITSIAS